MLAPQRRSDLAHGLYDIAVANVRTDQFPAVFAHKDFQGHIAHDGTDQLPSGKLIPPHQIQGADSHDLISIQHPARFVYDNQAVCVAIQGQADISPGFKHFGRGHLGMERAAAVVDVQAIRRGAKAQHFRAEFLQGQGRNLVVGSVGAIDDHAQAIQIDVRGNAGLDGHNIPSRSIGDSEGAADLFRRRIGPLTIRIQSHGGNVIFYGIRQFKAPVVEKFDAVVMKGVMGSGNNNAAVGPHVAGQKSDGRGGQRAHLKHVHTGRAEPGGKGRLVNIAGKPGIFADNNPVAAVALPKLNSGGKPQAQSRLRQHGITVDPAPDAIGAKKTFFHTRSPVLERYTLRAIYNTRFPRFRNHKPGKTMGQKPLPCAGTQRRRRESLLPPRRLIQPQATRASCSRFRASK